MVAGHLGETCSFSTVVLERGQAEACPQRCGLAPSPVGSRGLAGPSRAPGSLPTSRGSLQPLWLCPPAVTEFGSEKQLVLARIPGPSQMETVPSEESAGNLSGNALALGPLACLTKAKLITLRQGMLQMERDSWLQTEVSPQLR